MVCVGARIMDWAGPNWCGPICSRCGAVLCVTFAPGCGRVWPFPELTGVYMNAVDGGA